MYGLCDAQTSGKVCPPSEKSAPWAGPEGARKPPGAERPRAHRRARARAGAGELRRGRPPLRAQGRSRGAWWAQPGLWSCHFIVAVSSPCGPRSSCVAEGSCSWGLPAPLFTFLDRRVPGRDTPSFPRSRGVGEELAPRTPLPRAEAAPSRGPQGLTWLRGGRGSQDLPPQSGRKLDPIKLDQEAFSQGLCPVAPRFSVPAPACEPQARWSRPAGLSDAGTLVGKG